MDNDSKKLAAIAGVMALINAKTPVSVPRREPDLPTPWAAYSRQQTMQYRDITQRRIIKRTR